ncbi:MAG: class I SAM-dependent methyltransferase [Coleofasciculus sp. C1-SOL-03]|uniref:class I SAM-dependent methyltransferase n=1 Tax=Coleofasciculus sp. C1-SOL-03 TaxID=3069522 RepID=UPI0032FAE04D
MVLKIQPCANWYKQLFAWGMAKANTADENAIQLANCSNHSTLAQLKQALFADLQGKVVEIGPGAGVNLEYYPTDIHWIGVEPNPFMHSYLEQEAQQVGLNRIDINSGSAERIDVDDNSVDAVVSTYVLCSVSNLSATVQEIRRVLKPGGRFLFVEHIAAECGSWQRRIQGSIEPIWKTVFDGCHPNRETGLALEKAGFENLNYQQFQVSFPIVSPHISGVATKSRDVS